MFPGLEFWYGCVTRGLFELSGPLQHFNMARAICRGQSLRHRILKRHYTAILKPIAPDRRCVASVALVHLIAEAPIWCFQASDLKKTLHSDTETNHSRKSRILSSMSTIIIPTQRQQSTQKLCSSLHDSSDLRFSCMAQVIYDSSICNLHRNGFILFAEKFCFAFLVLPVS